MRINWSKLAAALLLGGVFLPLAWWQGGQIGRGTTATTSTTVRLQVGDCLNTIPGATLTGVELVDCDSPHDHEVFGIGEIGDLDGYDAGRIAARADEICIELFASYTGSALADSDLTATHVTPSAETWDAGDRTVVCLLAGSDGALTGSVRGSG